MRSILKIVGKPLFWAWAFVVIWVSQVAITLLLQRWGGLTISLIGLLAALLVVSAIMSRRRKTLYPDSGSGNHEPGYQSPDQR